jgi:hypothetical protein
LLLFFKYKTELAVVNRISIAVATYQDDTDGDEPRSGDRTRSRKYATGFNRKNKLSGETRRGNHIMGERKKRIWTRL